jgi:hypothetical protein
VYKRIPEKSGMERVQVVHARSAASEIAKRALCCDKRAQTPAQVTASVVEIAAATSAAASAASREGDWYASGPGAGAEIYAWGRWLRRRHWRRPDAGAWDLVEREARRLRLGFRTGRQGLRRRRVLQLEIAMASPVFPFPGGVLVCDRGRQGGAERTAPKIRGKCLQLVETRTHVTHVLCVVSSFQKNVR